MEIYPHESIFVRRLSIVASAVLWAVYFVLGFFRPFASMPVLGWHWAIRFAMILCTPLVWCIIVGVPTLLCCFFENSIYLCRDIAESVDAYDRFNSIWKCCLWFGTFVTLFGMLFIAPHISAFAGMYAEVPHFLATLLIAMMGTIGFILGWAVCWIIGMLVTAAITAIISGFKELFAPKAKAGWSDDDTWWNHY